LNDHDCTQAEINTNMSEDRFKRLSLRKTSFTQDGGPEISPTKVEEPNSSNIYGMKLRKPKSSFMEGGEEGKDTDGYSLASTSTGSIATGTSTRASSPSMFLKKTTSWAGNVGVASAEPVDPSTLYALKKSQSGELG
jgi:hypothetical protein